MMKSLDEFKIIDVAKKNSTHSPGKAVLGIGDDCAIIDHSKDRYTLATIDMLIEGVHFNLKEAGAYRVGRKALAVSLSDIAAMAGTPKYALLSLGIPAYIDMEDISDFYKGFTDLASQFSVQLIGGDTNNSEKLICDTCVIGESAIRKTMRRSGAKIGDAIFVTGELGGSIKGKQYDFTPRVEEARKLVDLFDIHSMIDISDGLSSDLQHVTASSKTGAEIYEASLPVSKEAVSKEAALSDGEDFELLFTASEDISDRELNESCAVQVTRIGKIREYSKGVTIVRASGMREVLRKTGYRHF
ncbi:MAG: thiamine-monophosphate kinase [Candidatus Omnitrophica bacterium]|nr:thiamine-monophosphate kinase [Candidatus Omnitrophota bacterium]